MGATRCPASGAHFSERDRGTGHSKGGTLAERKNTMDGRRMTSQETGRGLHHRAHPCPWGILEKECHNPSGVWHRRPHTNSFTRRHVISREMGARARTPLFLAPKQDGCLRPRSAHRKVSAPVGCGFDQSPHRGDMALPPEEAGLRVVPQPDPLKTVEAVPTASPFPPDSGHTSVSCPHPIRVCPRSILWTKNDSPSTASASSAETDATASSRSAP